MSLKKVWSKGNRLEQTKVLGSKGPDPKGSKVEHSIILQMVMKHDDNGNLNIDNNLYGNNLQEKIL
jgi:hypothetical protein